MRFRIELLGDFRLTDLATGRSVALRSYAGIIAVLVFAEGKYVSRGDIIAKLWADTDDGTARNRMRVALARLRTVLGNAVTESEGAIALNTGEVAADVWEAREILQAFADSVDAKSQMALLRSWAHGVDWEKALRWRGEGRQFFGSVESTLRKGVAAGMGAGLFDDTLALAEYGLQIAPGDDEFLLAALQAGVELDKGSWVAQRYESQLAGASARNPDIKEVLGQIRKGGAKPTGLSALNRQFMIRLIETGVESHPELIRPLLSQAETLPLAGAYPREMLLLLERVTRNAAVRDEAWERCTARMIGLRAWLNDAEGVLRDAPALLESSENPVVQRATWNYVSVAHSLMRNWDEAFRALDETERFARDTGDAIDLASVIGTRAYYLMHCGEYGESARAYQESFAMLAASENPRAKLDYAVGFGNSCFLPVFQGNWETARARLEEGIATRAGMTPPAQHGLLKAALAYAYAQCEVRGEVLGLMQSALYEAFEGESERDQQITFEYAGATLACLGDAGFAAGLNEWILAWRARTSLARSFAEESLCGAMKRGKDEIALHENEAPERVGRETIRRLRLRLA